jgi:hypothetical protein
MGPGGRTTDRPSEPTIAYEPPKLEDLGSLAELTLGPARNSLGDGVSRNGPRIFS